MIVECSLEGGLQLTEPFDFRRFKLVLRGVAASEFHSWRDITFVDDNNALVPIALVRALHGRLDDVEWEKSFAEMVTKARKHGWVLDESSAIRAHIERQR